MRKKIRNFMLSNYIFYLLAVITIEIPVNILFILVVNPLKDLVIYGKDSLYTLSNSEYKKCKKVNQ